MWGVYPTVHELAIQLSVTKLSLPNGKIKKDNVQLAKYAGNRLERGPGEQRRKEEANRQ